MSEQQEAIVLAIENNGMAKVKTSRHNDCESCGACPGNSAIVLDAQNPLGAKPGQLVLIEVKEAEIIKSAFIVYLLPLIAIFAGVMSGGYLAELLAVDGLWLQVGGGCLTFGISVLYIKYFDRRASTNTKMQPVIKRILT